MDVRSQMLLGLALFSHMNAFGFGQDVCFEPDPSTNNQQIVNCIGVDESCRTSHLSPKMQIRCRLAATKDSISGLTGGTVMVGGRSLIHTDATYLMAQLIGFTPWQSYEMAIYSEATDQVFYTPFSQMGKPLLSNDDISACQTNWGVGMANDCLLTTPAINGVSRFNASSGGMWLHLHARYSDDGQNLPGLPFPVDYLSPKYAQTEKLLNDFHAWVFDEKSAMCVYGITQNGNAECALVTSNINSLVNLGPLGFDKLSVPFVTPLGTFMVNEMDQTGQTPVYANNDSLQSYVTPQDAAYAKMGIFIHSLGDRYSHHMCSDRSYFFQNSDDDYISVFDTLYCAQGSHFLWHAWEQGTSQTDANLDPNFQTMRPALEAVHAQLIAYAQHQGITIQTVFDRDKLIDQMITVLGIYDPNERLAQMVTLMENYHVLPLPGHGSVANISNEAWLNLAGAPV